MADPSDFAYTPPSQANAYGSPQYAFDTGPGTGKPDMPQRVVAAQGGAMSAAQADRYHDARRAATSAQENINDAMGIKPSYGKRFTSPDDATNYRAW